MKLTLSAVVRNCLTALCVESPDLVPHSLSDYQVVQFSQIRKREVLLFRMRSQHISKASIFYNIVKYKQNNISISAV